MEMEMIDGYIESISTRASESSKAMSVSEDVMLSFHEVNLTYYAYDPAKSLRVAMPSFQSVQADF